MATIVEQGERPGREVIEVPPVGENGGINRLEGVRQPDAFWDRRCPPLLVTVGVALHPAALGLKAQAMQYLRGLEMAESP